MRDFFFLLKLILKGGPMVIHKYCAVCKVVHAFRNTLICGGSK